MNPEHSRILVAISSELQNVLKESKQNLPLICHALSSKTLNEHYSEIKDTDLADLSWYRGRNSGTPEYFLGALLLFVRNFYERGDGRDIWKSTPSLSSPEAKKGFTACIRNHRDCRQWRNSLFPSTERCIGLEWVRSQCWVLKAEVGGDTSAMLRNNSIVYKRCIEIIGTEVEWVDLLDSESQVRKEFESVQLEPEDFESFPSYIDCILSNYREAYFLSLYALVASADEVKPDGLPQWLSALWSSAYDVMRRERRKVYADAMSVRGGWKLILNGNVVDVYLTYQADACESVKAIQGNLEFELQPFSCVPSLDNLQKSGFEVHRDITLVAKKETRERRCLISGLRKEASIFSCSENEVTERSLLSEKGHTREVPANRQIYVVSQKSSNNLALTFDGQDVELFNESCVGKYGGYRCYRGVLHRSNHPAKAPLSINGKTVVNLIERPVVRILNATPEIDAVCNNTRVHVIEGHRIEYSSSATRVTIDPSSEYVEGRDIDEGEHHIRYVDDDKVGLILKISASRGNISRNRSFICLPPDWKKSNQCSQPNDDDLFESATRSKTRYVYTTVHGEQVQLETRIDKTLVFWVKSKEPIKCGALHSLSDIERYNKVAAYTNQSFCQLDFTINGRSVYKTSKFSITAKKIRSILQDYPLRRGDKIRITINNVEAFSSFVQ